MFRLALLMAMLTVGACAIQAEPRSSVARASTAYLILELDSEWLQSTQLVFMSALAATAFDDASPPIAAAIERVGDDALQVHLADARDQVRAMAALRHLEGDGLSLTSREAHSIEVRLSPSAFRRMHRHAVRQNVQVIRRRLEEIGAAEFRVDAGAEGRILIEATGVTSEQLSEMFPSPARVTFHLVHDPSTPGEVQAEVTTAPPHPDFSAEMETVVVQPPYLTGARLTRLYPTVDVRGEFVVAFQFDEEGSSVFCEVTTAHVGRRFAVLLNGQVVTSPRIQEPICEGSGHITGEFTAQSANELAASLWPGALPTRMRPVEGGYRN